MALALQDVVDEPGEIVDGRRGGLVHAKRRISQPSLIDGRESSIHPYECYGQ
jgi:hypothetical protein